MNRAALGFRRACYVALLLGAGAGTSPAQSLPFRLTVTPVDVSTRGGTPVYHNIAGGATGLSATVDGVPAQFLNRVYGVVVIAPPRATIGAATLVLDYTHSVYGAFTATTTINYIDLPQAGLTTALSRVSVADDGSQSVGGVNDSGNHSGVSSMDGRFVAFLTDSRFNGASPGGTLVGIVKDRQTGALTRLTCPNGGVCNPLTISLDGGRIAFGTNAGALYVVDAPFDVTPTPLDVNGSGTPPSAGSVMLSGNGRFLAFRSTVNLDGAPGDVASTDDLFVRDLTVGMTERWTTAAGVSGDIGISADGRAVVFQTTTALAADDANGVRDAYVLDRANGTFRCLTPDANGNSSSSAISADGSTVAFSSAATNLVGGDTNAANDVFALDLATGEATRVTPERGGSLAGRIAVSANGRRVVFLTTVPDLPASVVGVYVHDRQIGDTWLVNAEADGTVAGPGYRGLGASIPGAGIAPDGRGVTFATTAPVVSDDSNAMADVFRKELPPDTPAGSNVEAVPIDPATGETPVALTFASVTVPGDTSVTYGDTAPPLPEGFQLGSRFVDITTTASFTGSVTVCVEYEAATTPDPSALQLRHYEGGVWVNITTSLDTVAHVVCGQTMSLSPFVLATPPAVTFSVRSLLEEGRVFKAGSTIPIRVQILDASGANVSAENLSLVATGVRRVSSQTDWAVPEDPGQSNPDLGFQFTQVESAPGYRFNLKTTGLAAGTYELRFLVGASGPALEVQFQVR